MWFLLSLFFALWSSIATPLSKRLMAKASPLTYLVTSNLFILIFLFILAIILGLPNVPLTFYFLLLVSSSLDCIAFISSYWAIKHSPISLISPIASFNPLFTTLIALLFLHETLNISKFLGILTIVFGSYCLNVKDIKHGLFKPFKSLFSDKGVLLFLMANFLWGITPVFQKKAILLTHPKMPLFPSLVGLVFVLTFLTPLALKRNPKQLIPFARKNFWFLLLIGIFTALAQLAAFTAFSLTNVGYVTAVLKLSTLFTIIWGAIFFKEKRIKERFLGASIMLLGTFLLIF